MNRQQSINDIITYSSRFVEEVRQYNNLGLYDINIHAENFLIPVLNEVLDLKLVNLNSAKRNYPALDLADFHNRVGIQISSTSTTQKVLDSLNKFVNNGQYEYFDVVYFFFLTEKQKSYPDERIQQIVSKGGLVFDSKQHIISNSELINRLSHFSLEKLSYLARLYKHEFSDAQIDSRKNKFESGYLINEVEDLFCNLLKITVPKTLFSAELNIDEAAILDRVNAYRESNGWRTFKTLRTEKLLVEELKEQQLNYKDWVLWRNRLYTFSDLTNKKEPFYGVIDQGTVEENDSQDFYMDNQKHLRVFKNLLRQTLIEDVYDKDLEWFPKKQILRFRLNPNNKGEKKVKWKATNVAEKTVIFEKKNKKEGHIICYKHLAFKPSFELLDGKWYLVINSTWSFTNPGGYKTSRFEESYLSGIKRLEDNKTVYYFYRFWSYYLRHIDLFSKTKRILELSEFIPLKHTPALKDEKWLPVKVKKDNNQNEEKDNELNLLKNLLN